MKKVFSTILLALFLLTATVALPFQSTSVWAAVDDQKKGDKKKDPPGPPPVVEKGNKGGSKPPPKKPGN